MSSNTAALLRPAVHPHFIIIMVNGALDKKVQMMCKYAGYYFPKVKI